MTATIRPLELQDAADVFTAVDRSRPELSRWMQWCRSSYSVLDATEWVRQSCTHHRAGSGYHFVICDEAGMVIGVVSLENVESAAGSAMLGYWVATPAAGRGAATSAIAQVLTWASGHSDLRNVWALIAPDNVASRRAVEANGFRLVGPVSQASPAARLRYEVTIRHEPAA